MMQEIGHSYTLTLRGHCFSLPGAVSFHPGVLHTICTVYYCVFILFSILADITHTHTHTHVHIHTEQEQEREREREREADHLIFTLGHKAFVIDLSSLLGIEAGLV